MSDGNLYPENIDLNQGIDWNTTSMEDNGTRENPEETSWLTNNLFSFNEENNTPQNLPRANNALSNGGFFPGESSPNANSRIQLFGRELNPGNVRSSSANASTVVNTSAIQPRYPQVSSANASTVVNSSAIRRASYISIYDIFSRPSDRSSTFGPSNANLSQNDLTPNGVSLNNHQPGGSEAQHFQNNDGLVSSSILGSSCKRKADEGCSDDPSMFRRSFPGHLNASGSNGVINERSSVRINHGPLAWSHLLAGVGNFGVEARNGQHQESSTLGFSANNSGLYPTNSGSVPLNQSPNHSYLVQNSTIQYPRSQFFCQGSSSSDPRSEIESSARTVPTIPQPNPSTLWSVPPGWETHQNPETYMDPRMFAQSPWIQFPPVGPTPGVQRGNFSPFPSGGGAPPMVAAIPQSGSITSAEQNRSFPQPLPRDVAPNDMSELYALVRRYRRDRLTSQAHNARGRSENIEPEDFVIDDPYLSEVEDLHDNHIDLRLDVDNMSYEELLELEEHIGNVNTGLNEETMMQFLKKKKYNFVAKESSSNQEPCCVCQEEYVVGDDIGELNCGHQFHTICIKQWLMLKNICPICKLTGLKP